MTNILQRITINEKFSFDVKELTSHIAKGVNTDGEPVDPILADVLANAIMASPNVQEAIDHTIDLLGGWSTEPTISEAMLDFVGYFFYCSDDLGDFANQTLDITI